MHEWYLRVAGRKSSDLIRIGLLKYDGNSPVFLQGQKFMGPSRSEGLG